MYQLCWMADLLLSRCNPPERHRPSQPIALTLVDSGTMTLSEDCGKVNVRGGTMAPRTLQDLILYRTKIIMDLSGVTAKSFIPQGLDLHRSVSLDLTCLTRYVKAQSWIKNAAYYSPVWSHHPSMSIRAEVGACQQLVWCEVRIAALRHVSGVGRDQIRHIAGSLPS